MDVQQITTAELAEWATFVADSPAATGFHAAGWRAVLSEAFAVKPLFLRARDNAGRIAGVLPLFRSRSALFGDFISSLEDGHCAADVETARALGQGALDVLAREKCDCLTYKTNFATDAYANAQTVQTVKTVVSTNRSLDIISASIDKKTRWGVRNGTRQGYRVRVANDLLVPFHSVYAANLHRLGTPAFGSAVFEAMRRHLGASLAFYALEHGDRLVGGMVCLKAAQEWTSLYASIEDEAQRQYAGYLLYWTVIEEAAQSGVARVNLGRSIAGSGVHRFKHKWTDEDVRTPHYLFGTAADRVARRLGAATTHIGLARRLWTHLPAPIAQVGGRYLRRYLPFV